MQQVDVATHKHRCPKHPRMQQRNTIMDLLSPYVLLGRGIVRYTDRVGEGGSRAGVHGCIAACFWGPGVAFAARSLVQRPCVLRTLHSELVRGGKLSIAWVGSARQQLQRGLWGSPVLHHKTSLKTLIPWHVYADHREWQCAAQPHQNQPCIAT